MFERKFALACVTGVGLTEYSMSITGYNPTALQRVPDELAKIFITYTIGTKVGNELNFAEIIL